MFTNIGVVELLMLMSVPLVLIVIGAVVAVFLRRAARDGRRRCRYCAELIPPEATLCRYCGRDVEPVTGVGT